MARYRWPREWRRVRPQITPRAFGSLMGLRSPAKYGRTMRPSDPGGTPEASSESSEKGLPSAIFLTHSVSAPDVAMPPARTLVPENGPAVLQRFDDGRGSPTISMVRAVVPYMTIRSPGSRTPTLAASDQASTVPVTTGMPSGSPVASAASRVTSPATSAGQRSSGSSRPGATSSAHSSIQRSCLWS